MSVSQTAKQQNSIIKLWLPVLACMCFIFYASSIQGKNIPFVFTFQDTAFHLFVYLMLAYLFSRALKGASLNFTPIKIIIFAVMFGVLYGISDELHQAFVPYRSASGFDVFIDGSGSFLGSIIYAARNIISGSLKLSNRV